MDKYSYLTNTAVRGLLEQSAGWVPKLVWSGGRSTVTQTDSSGDGAVRRAKCAAHRGCRRGLTGRL
jgi:hypothetical protein